MGTAAGFRNAIRSSANEGPSAAYVNGLADGCSARTMRHPITIYLQVGIDDYSKGFRAGFFGRESKEPPEAAEER